MSNLNASLKKEEYIYTGVQGDHYSFDGDQSELYRFLNIHNYIFVHKLNDEQKKNPKAMAGSGVLGIDRYKDFLVVYDLDSMMSVLGTSERSVYIIYDKNKSFHPKSILKDLNPPNQIVQYHVTQPFVEEEFSHRITRIKTYTNCSNNWLKLIQYLKLQLQYYPLVDQLKFNEKLRLAVKEFQAGKPTEGLSLYDKLDHIFMAQHSIATILRDTIFPDVLCSMIIEEDQEPTHDHLNPCLNHLRFYRWDHIHIMHKYEGDSFAADRYFNGEVVVV